MPGTEPEPFGQAMEERLRRELDAVQPQFSSPRYLTHVRRPVAWRLAPAALAAALVGIVGLAAYSGSPNPAVWTQHIFSVGHEASPTPNELASPKSSPVERESPEPSESPEPHESPEPSGSPEPRDRPSRRAAEGPSRAARDTTLPAPPCRPASQRPRQASRRLPQATTRLPTWRRSGVTRTMKRPVVLIVGAAAGALLVAAAGASAHTALFLSSPVGQHATVLSDEATGAATETPEPAETPEAPPTAEPTDNPEPTETPEAPDNDNDNDNDNENDNNQAQQSQDGGGGDD